MIEITDQMVKSLYYSFDLKISKHDIRTALQNALTPPDTIPLLRDDNHDRVIYDFETFDGDWFDIGILSSDSTELWVVGLLEGPLNYTVPVSEVAKYTNQKMTRRISKVDFNPHWDSVEL